MEEEIYDRYFSRPTRSGPGRGRELKLRVASVSAEDAHRARSWRHGRTRSGAIAAARAAVERVLAHCTPPEILDCEGTPVECIEDVPKDELAEIYREAPASRRGGPRRPRHRS
jgi:hypothetical protein